MKELVCSGLPIWLDEKTMRLELRDGLTIKGSGGKDAAEMRGLLMDENSVDGSVHCYDFYRDIVFEGDRKLYETYGYRYDITAIAPGEINGEYVKNSGHYHGYIEGQTLPYPEIYEVIHGELFFIMQKSKNFDKPDEEPAIESAKAVHVVAGQAIVVPPFYAHCAVNIGSEPVLFSNIAVVACPLFYDPIKRRHGLCHYVVEKDGKPAFVRNPHYIAAPEIELVEPKEDEALGIVFGKPIYREFIEHPEIYRFMLDPAPYVDRLERMLAK